MSEQTLPQGWLWTTLGEVANYGKTVKAEPSEIKPEEWVLELEDIEKASSKLLQRIENSVRQTKSTKNRFKKGDTLYGKLRPYLNKVLLADKDGVCSTEIIPLSAPVGIDERYLFYSLKRPDFIEYVTDISHGLNMPRLGTKAGQDALIPLAPSNEQKRIADKLDQLLAAVDSCKARLDAIPGIIKRFRQSVLAAATSGELTTDWREDRNVDRKIVTVGSLCEQSFYGPRFGKDEYTTDGIPTIRTTDMTRDGRIEITSGTPRVNVSANKLDNFKVKKGDLLITRTGSIGIMAVFDGDYLAMPSAYLIRFRFSDFVLPRYMFYCLMAPAGQEMLGLSTTAITQPNINAEAIKRIAIELPNIDEQHEIVRRVEALFEVADRVEARYQQARAKVDQLIPTLLAKAFRGELVPQDPNDEPAEKLLERIKAQPPAAPKQKAQKTVAPKAAPPPLAKPTSPTATAPPLADDALADLSKIARKILRRMKVGKTYARADIVEALNLMTSDWTVAINELKVAGLVAQTGEKRGARYALVGSRNISPIY